MKYGFSSFKIVLQIGQTDGREIMKNRMQLFVGTARSDDSTKPNELLRLTMYGLPLSEILKACRTDGWLIIKGRVLRSLVKMDGRTTPRTAAMDTLRRGAERTSLGEQNKQQLDQVSTQTAILAGRWLTH